MTKTIEVIVSPRGETTLQTHSFSGPTCLEASKFLEQALGAVAAERKTEEFYTSAQADQQLRQ